jgi:hypothetical protein
MYNLSGNSIRLRSQRYAGLEDSENINTACKNKENIKTSAKESRSCRELYKALKILPLIVHILFIIVHC